MFARVSLPGRYAADKVEQYAHAAIDVYITAPDDPCLLGWNGEDDHDYTPFDHLLGALTRALPEIRVILYVGCPGEAPYRWCRAHPDELTAIQTGGRLVLPSAASARWREDSSRALQALVRHLEDGPHARNVIGYNPVYCANEWFGRTWQAQGRDVGYDDYSPAMRAHFRAWLRRHYEDDVARLRHRWGQSGIEFDTVELPTVEERMAFDQPGLFLADRAPSVADYVRCYHEANADLAIAWCHAIKEASPRPKLVGLMHGYTWCAGPAPQLRGMGGVQRLLDSPWIDYLHSAPNYVDTRAAHLSMLAPDSLPLHRKLFINQIDAKTFLLPQDRIVLNSEGMQPGSIARNRWETEQIMKRDVSYAVSKNSAMYWLEGGPGSMFPIHPHGIGGAKLFSPLWYDDEGLKALMRQLKQWVDRQAVLGATSTAEVALLGSNQSNYYRRPERNYAMLYADGLRTCVLSRTGAPFDDFIVEDFPRLPRDYPLYVLADCLYLTRPIRRAIRARIEAGATVVFFHAPGYFDEEGGSLAHTEELTGIKLGRDDQEQFLDVELVRHPWTEATGAGQVFGTGVGPDDTTRAAWRNWPQAKDTYQFSPLVFVADADVEVLGRIRSSARVGAAVKRVGRGRSVFFSAPLPPWTLLRDIFKASGVNIYSGGGDLVYGHTRMLALYARSAGRRVIQLPRPMDVREALSGSVLATGAREFVLESRELETHLLEIE